MSDSKKFIQEGVGAISTASLTTFSFTRILESLHQSATTFSIVEGLYF